jgi:hypothetical protein
LREARAVTADENPSDEAAPDPRPEPRSGDATDGDGRAPGGGADALALNPFVTVTPDYGDGEGRLVIRNYAENEAYRLPNPYVLELFGMAAEAIERPALLDRMEAELGVDRSTARAVLVRLETIGVLISPDAVEFQATAVRSEWRDDGWAEAFRYYFTTRSYPFDRMLSPEKEHDRIERRREKRGAIPPVYKTYPGAPTVELPAVDGTEPLAAVRELCRGTADADADLSLTVLSRILYYTFGETGTQSMPQFDTDLLLKTSPSGGGRHPTEAYLQLFDVEGVPSGAYHYSVKEHALERLDPEVDSESTGGDAASARSEAGASGAPARGSASTRPECEVGSTAGVLETRFGGDGGDPSAVVVAASRIERVWWKYRDPRAMRIAHHDVGHLLETLRIVTRGEGVPTEFAPPPAPAALAEHFGLERLEEPLVGTAILY